MRSAQACIGLGCPAGRSVPGRGGPERRRRPRPDGTGPSVRTGSVAHRDYRGTSGQQRSQRATRNRRLPALQPRQRTDARWRFRLRSRRPEVRVPHPKSCRGPAALAHEASGRRGRASSCTRAEAIAARPSNAGRMVRPSQVVGGEKVGLDQRCPLGLSGRRGETSCLVAAVAIEPLRRYCGHC
jgi:hypothetical protein